jgi:ADP-ribosylglycohydrolase
MRLVFGSGMVSDDTEHTFMVAGCLAAHPDDVVKFDRALAWKLRGWFASLPAGTGMATAKACIRLWLCFGSKRSGVFSAGNGPAMRSAIIGVYFNDSPSKRREFVRAATRITHTDPKAEVAAQAVAECAAWASGDRSVSQNELLRELRGLSVEPEWLRAFDLIGQHLEISSPVRDFAGAMNLSGGVTGYAFHTVPVAVYSWFRHPSNFREALVSVLDCGGDTDTVGAITGALAGATLGCAAIPQDWQGGIIDWPLSLPVLRRAAGVLAGDGGRFPFIFWPLSLTRNLLFLLMVLAHGFRRLFPPY